MSQYIASHLRQQVIARAQARCEYCLIHQEDTPFSHHIDHIIARQHGGETELENLALACLDCNKYKGPNLSSIDPMTGNIVTLFNPRVNEWETHFYLIGSILHGRTPCGRATASLLQFNTPLRLIQRQLLIATQRYPYA